MQHESTGDDMSMPGHTVMSDSSQRHVEICSQIRTDVRYCGEETNLGEYADFTLLQQPIVIREHLHYISSCMGYEGWRLVDPALEELLPVVLDDWESVMSTGEYVPWMPMDEILVDSFRLTKACDVLQIYSQL
jgi:hypothetical protein